MYLLSNGRSYIGLSPDTNKPTTVCNIKKALGFSEKQKAINFKENLKNTLKKFDWVVVEIEKNSASVKVVNENGNTTREEDRLITSLENDFDIIHFFQETIETVSQLKEYAVRMGLKEQEYNEKISDVRHYKRSPKTKLNAIQLQRLEQFEIKLERERYECKSNRLIAEIFLVDFNRLQDKRYLKEITDIKESEYKPRILTYKLIDEIVGKREKTNERTNY